MWLANAAAVLALLGISTTPGFVIIDFYDSALGRIHGGVDTALAAEKLIDGMWVLPVLAGTGTLGFMLALPLAAAAARRAGRMPWWAAVAVIAGIVGFAASSATLWGTVALSAGFAIFSLALARARWESAVPAEGPSREQ